MEFREIYCDDCKRVLVRYNLRYYSEDMVAGLIHTIHVTHIQVGHHVNIKKKKSENV